MKRAMLQALGAISIVAYASLGRADAPTKRDSGTFAEVSAGRALARFLPLDDEGTDAEHFAASGHQFTLGFGYGFAFEKARVDVGARLQYLRLLVEGNYSIGYRDDAYRANYDYVGPQLTATLASAWDSRVNASVGFGIGTAMLYSDRKGRPFRGHLLPVYGSFETGLLFRLDEDLELRTGVSFVPPVDNIYVVTPQLALRTRL